MIHYGDVFDVLPTFDADSIDACVTDPPYGIGFMGKQWDTFSPARARASKMFAMSHGAKGRRDSQNQNIRGRRQSPAMSPSQIEYDLSLSGQRMFQDWSERWAREVYRVLKPGAHLLVCGSPRSYHRMASGIEDAGFEIRDCLCWLFGQGFPKSLNLPGGLGTALKPAYEPILLARRPLVGTVAANVERYWTGALNVDLCRIETDGCPLYAESSSGLRSTSLGRWPANVVIDEGAATMLDRQTGFLHAPGLVSPSYIEKGKYDADKVCYANGIGSGRTPFDYADSGGGASRFFYVAKPSRKERDFGCDGSGNSHPTVKPIALMRWLVRLVTHPSGIVLDPFTGSGTTGMACRYEHRGFIGIEREPEYVAIAERRIATVAPLFADTDAVCTAGSGS